MSKRTRTSKNDKWLKEGRETGRGVDYKPLVNVQVVFFSVICTFYCNLITDF
ncbi:MULTISPECIES: hypothetical protein [Bacillus cereus group]|uniref:hypothetical protein n=1 Tax=Bacillus cereus group TaxID=86661 RepID=UPI0015CF3D06|nr:hypothetical protein [Bacillus toyonensis]